MATHYCGPASSGANTGADWANVWDFDSVTFVRGDTYWIMGGTYSRSSLPTLSGTSLVTITKATTANHGTDTGWSGLSEAQRTGQAVFPGIFTVSMSYVLIDGQFSLLNPTAYVAQDTSTYGIKINYTGTSAHNGVLKIYQVSNVEIRGVHVYSLYRSSLGNYDIRSVEVYGNSSYIALKYCFFDGSATDQFCHNGGSRCLVDHCFFLDGGQRKAGSPDYHGQTIYTNYYSYAVVRFCIFKNCEGQAVWSIDDNNADNLRFYGNVIFNSTDNDYSDGFNTSGGIIDCPDDEILSGMYVYHNTIARMPASAPSGDGDNVVYYYNHTNSASPFVVYNILEYACVTVGTAGSVTCSHWATGGGTNPNKPNQQTGITTDYFEDYANSDFRLTQHTTAGLDLTAQSWWNDDADAFFGQLDYAVDMVGTARTNWDRGAFEYVTGETPPIATITLEVR